MARVYYPLFFVFTVAGFWFSTSSGQMLRKTIIDQIVYHFQDTSLILGVPMILWLGMGVVITILALFGGRLYTLDFNLVYGRVFKKLGEIVADMEELRS